VAQSIHPGTAIGAVALTVRDLDRSLDFYEHAIGFRALEGDGADATLGADDAPLLRLHADPEAPERPRRTTGLFHLAILVPDRAELARSLQRAASAGWRLTGASDHLVSEALYLSDPDGNGIEIYCDRDPSTWPRRNGEIDMQTLPLDVESLLAELS
jgi:catechol 2,3-dioxygenase